MKIDKNHLENTNILGLDAVNRAAEIISYQHAAMVNNIQFQDLLKDISKIAPVIERAMDTYKPFIEQRKKLQDSINLLAESLRLNLEMPTLNVKQELYCRPDPKVYSEAELKEIISQSVKTAVAEITESKLNLNPTSNGFPYRLSKNFQWESITIKFKDRHNIQIITSEYIYVANYKEMGFENANTLKPNSQWSFLEELSRHKGELCWRESPDIQKAQKNKQLLSKKLKRYFGINHDPFETSRAYKIYRIKINLIPENEPINIPSEEDSLGIKEAYEDLTAS